jgi:hypothetical protein
MASSLENTVDRRRLLETRGPQNFRHPATSSDLVNEALDELVQNWSTPQQGPQSAVPVTKFLATVRKFKSAPSPASLT